LTRLLFATLSALSLFVLAACGGGGAATTPTPSPDPIDLVQQTAENIRSADTFRLAVTQQGPDYAINTDYGSVLFRRASAQYVSPGVIQASVRVNAAGIPLDVDVFSRGENQWYRAIWTGNNWLNQAFSPGFNPESLIAEDTGFQAAMDSVIDLSYIGTTTLENGANVHHLRGTADGSDVNALLVGLIETQGVVGVDIFIDQTTLYPARVTLTETVYDEDGTPTVEPRIWTIDILDINAPANLDDPEVGARLASPAESIPDAAAESIPDAAAESTPDSTAEMTPEPTESSGA
jgi:hypothetical protein